MQANPTITEWWTRAPLFIRGTRATLPGTRHESWAFSYSCCHICLCPKTLTRRISRQPTFYSESHVKDTSLSTDSQLCHTNAGCHRQTDICKQERSPSPTQLCRLVEPSPTKWNSHPFPRRVVQISSRIRTRTGCPMKEQLYLSFIVSGFVGLPAHSPHHNGHLRCITAHKDLSIHLTDSRTMCIRMQVRLRHL